MKKIFLLLLLSMTFTLTSCNQSIPQAKADYSKLYQVVKASANAVKVRRFAVGIDEVWNKGFAGDPVPETANNAEYDAAAPEAALGAGAGYSGTNNQVDGIDEGDIVKTDGNYIYIASNGQNAVNVVKPDNGDMTLAATITKDGFYPSELQLYEDRLVIVWNGSTELKPLARFGMVPEDCIYSFWENEIAVEIYDTADFTEPAATYSQKGYLASSRMIGNYIYLVTSYTPSFIYSGAAFTEEDLECYVPSYTINGSTYFVAPEKIICPEKTDYVQYTTIAGIDVKSGNPLVSTASDMFGASRIYSSDKNIYLTTWAENDSTKINKYAINRGDVSYAASGTVEGYVQSQFWLDEYKDVLRVVTQVSKWDENSYYTAANLYALDANLNKLSEVNGIGEGENVQSVRFDKDAAYIVTFRQMDPLFAFDMSDPANPVKKDELKIPGYSRYLHKWSDNLLLGIGVDADINSGGRTGLKLSMFGVGDDQELSELHNYVIEADYAYTPAEYDHKSILVSPDKNIIAFPYTSNGTKWYSSGYSKNVYAVFEYDESGFTLLGEVDYANADTVYWGEFIRGMYIGDYIYAIGFDKVVSAKIGDLANTNELALFNYDDIYKQYYAETVPPAEPITTSATTEQ